MKSLSKRTVSGATTKAGKVHRWAGLLLGMLLFAGVQNVSAQAYQIVVPNPDATTLTVTLPYYEAVGVETYDLTIGSGSNLAFSNGTKTMAEQEFPHEASSTISFVVQMPGGTSNLVSGVYDLVIAGYSDHACEYELPFQIVIMTKPMLELNKSDIVFCFGASPINLIGEITNEDQFTASNLQLQYAWAMTGTAAGTASKDKANYPANGFTEALDITNTGTTLATGTYTVTPYVVYTTNDGREITIDGVSDNVAITVAPELTLTLAPSVNPICSGATDAIAVSTTSTDGTTTYQWKVKDAADGTYADVTAGAFAPAPTNTTNNQITASYTVKQTYTNGGATCTATEDVDLDVRPLPQATFAAGNTGVICDASDHEIAITTSVDGIKFAWTVADAANGVTNEQDSQADAALVGGELALTTSDGSGFTLAGNAAANLVYTITPKVESCAGTAMTYTLSVNPAPVLLLNDVSGNATAEICNITAATVNIKTTTTALTGQPVKYTITRNTGDFTVTETLPTDAEATTGGANWATGTLTNTSATKDYATAVYTVMPAIGSCTGDARTFTVTVVPPLDITVNETSFEICSEDPIAAITIGSGNADAVKNSGKFALTWSLPFDNTKLLVSVDGISMVGPTATGTGSLSDVLLTNVANPAAEATATLTATASYTTSGGADCTDATKTVALTVNPKPSFKLGVAPAP